MVTSNHTFAGGGQTYCLSPGCDSSFATLDFAKPLNVDWGVVIARSECDSAALAEVPGWKPLVRTSDMRPWSDDYSNILGL